MYYLFWSNYMRKILLLFLLLMPNILLGAPSVSLSTTSVYQGGKTTLYWDGFGGNVEIWMYKGDTKIVDAALNDPEKGSKEIEMSGKCDGLGTDWRILVKKKSDGTSRWTNYITVQKPSSPSLYRPNDLEIFCNSIMCNQYTSSIFFWWASNSDAKEYQLKVYRSSNESSTMFNESTGTTNSKTINIDNNWENNYYSWKVRVRVVATDYWSDWSSPREFCLDLPPSSSGQTLSTPQNWSCIKSNANQYFSWNWTTGETIQKYNIKIVKGNNLYSYSGINGDYDEPTSANRTIYINPTNYPVGEYIWGVRTMKKVKSGYSQSSYENIVGWGLFSTLHFYVTPTTPTGLALANSGTGFNITWNSSQGADSYEIFFGTTDDVTDKSNPLPPTSSLDFLHDGLIDGYTYYYRIRACYGSCKSDLSSTVSKKYEKPKPVLNTPVQLKDGNGNNSGAVQFSWNNVNAIRYELWIDNDGSFDAEGNYKSPEVCPRNKNYNNITGVSFEVSAGRLEPRVTYYAFVRAIYADNTTKKSEPVSFYYSPYYENAPVWAPLLRSFYSTEVDHFYCSSKGHLTIAKNSGFLFEGNEGYVSIKPFEAGTNNKLKCIYRFYGNPDPNNIKQKHHYYVSTTDSRNELITRKVGTRYTYEYEGIVGYTYENSIDGLTKLYHSYKNKDNIIDNFYTTNYAEFKNSISRFGYTDEGYLCYVSKVGNIVPPYANTPDIFTDFSKHSESCFSIPVGVLSLDFGINYSSATAILDNNNISVGYGWSHNYSAYLKFNDNDVTLYKQGGLFDVYPIPTNLNTEYAAKDNNSGVYDRLIKISNTEYRIKTKNQIKIQFTKLNSSDNLALLQSITDRNGNTLTCYYDAYYRLTEVAIPNNTDTYRKSLSFTYDNSLAAINDKSKLIKDVTDNSLGRKVSFKYDDYYNLIEYTDVMNKTTKYVYASDLQLMPVHLLTEVALPENKKITFSYANTTDTTKVGNNPIATQTISSSSNPMSISYTKIGTTSRVGVKLTNTGAETQYDFIPTSKIPGLPDQININGNKVAKYEYGSSTNPTLPTKITDAKNNVTNLTYDGMGNTKTISKPLNVNYSFDYNSTNDLTVMTNPKSKITNYDYDNNGNLFRVITPFGNASRCTTNINYYNTGLKNGLVKNTTDALQHTTNYEYDNYGNLTKVIDPLSNEITYDKYDAANRLEQVTKVNKPNNIQKNQVTKYTYFNNDLVNKVSQIDENNSEIPITYTYDDNKNIKTITDAKSNTTQKFYTDKNLLDYTINQSNQKTEYKYYDNGLVKSITKPKSNCVISYEYDTKFRLTKTSFDSFVYQFVYDNNDNLLKISDNINGDIRFDNDNGNNYDALDRLKSYTDFYGNTVSYEYDENSNIKKIIYPGNNYAGYTYYDDDLINTVKWNGTTIATYHYKNDGAIDYVDYGNGTNLQYNYDNAGRLTEMSNVKSDNEVINSYSYTLDNLGNQIGCYQEEPTIGIPDKKNISGLSYDAANRTTGINFDANGNQTQNSNSTNNNYNFDALNRLTSISHGDSFVYDAFGNRRAKNSTRYVIDINSDMSQILAETDGNNNVENYYIYGACLLARAKPDGTISYYHTDSRGSVIAMTDADQNIIQKNSYNEYGAVTNPFDEGFENDPSPFKYVGAYGVMDDGNGLYYMRARYYEVASKRFISEDPIWATNQYWYADGNAIMGIDPEGKENLKKNISNTTNTFSNSMRNAASENVPYNIFSTKPKYAYIKKVRKSWSELDVRKGEVLWWIITFGFFPQKEIIVYPQN